MNHASPSRSLITVCLLVLAAQTHAQLPAPPTSPVSVTNFEYDAQGNPTKSVVAPNTAGMAFATARGYDALNRVNTVVDAKNGLVQFGHDGLDRLTLVIDPRNLSTQYLLDGLGNQNVLVSPDTGTATAIFDAAGKLTSRTDARGVTSDFVYDALNRATTANHYTGSKFSGRKYQWTYDQTGNPFGYGVGRPTTAASPEVTTKLGYDALGRVTQTVQNVIGSVALTTQYGYDAAGHVTSITYPSGRVVTITYAQGLPTTVSSTASGSGGPLLSNIQFNPMGDVRRWDWNMATGLKAHDRVFDTSGRLVRYPLGPLVRDLVYDDANRITSFTHYDASTGAAQTVFNQGFQYDELGRLLRATSNSTNSTYGYDASGNRTLVAIGTSVQTYTTESSSNRLSSIANPARSFTYDAVGNTLSDINAGNGANYVGTYSFEGRLATMAQGPIGVAFAYDAQGLRVGRASWNNDGNINPPPGGGTNALRASQAQSAVVTLPITPTWPVVPSGSTLSGLTFYTYDLQGHLIGAYSAIGTPLAEYVWLGDIPVAVYESMAFAPLTVQLFYVHADHIDTPRALLDTQGNVRWRWMADPFGTAVPETQPTPGLAVVTYDLRMPGQQYEAFGGRFYNYFRDYDPTVGRYVQSDPIGLQGGINTYAYAGGSPAAAVDPSGLATIVTPGFNSFNEELQWRRKYKDLFTANQLIREQMAKQCPQLLKKFDDWVIRVDPNIDNVLKRARVGYMVTKYSEQSSQVNKRFFDITSGESPSQTSVFAHEFRHLTKANHDLYRLGDELRDPLTVPGEQDADAWARNLLGERCTCEK